jgi:hypothetical protein
MAWPIPDFAYAKPEGCKRQVSVTRQSRRAETGAIE